MSDLDAYVARRLRELDAKAHARMRVWRPKGKSGQWTPATDEERRAWVELEQADAGRTRLTTQGLTYHLELVDRRPVWRRWEGRPA